MFFFKKNRKYSRGKTKKRENICLNFEGDPGMVCIKYDREGEDPHGPVPDDTIVLAMLEFETYRAIMGGGIIA
jgi:hypothetical protein